MQKLFIFWFFVLVAGLAHADVASLVQNGAVVPNTSALYRSIAQLESAAGKCSASFLNATTLLTAGHCTVNQVASGMRVRMRDGQGVWFAQSASLVVTHPNYRRWTEGPATRIAYDFGIVKVAQPFALSVRPLKLVNPSGAAGTFRVKVAGFGKYAQGRSSSVLRQGSMLAQVGPLAQFGGGEGIDMIPVGPVGQATCAGDSGGPVLDDATLPSALLGVHSLSNGCSGPGEVHSYSQIPAHVQTWIARYL